MKLLNKIEIIEKEVKENTNTKLIVDSVKNIIRESKQFILK